MAVASSATAAVSSAAAVASSATPAVTFGELLRGWRQCRGLSQLALSAAANVSARHVSFLETGRAAPSRAMVLRLARVLDVPRHDQNRMLVAAGLAPAYSQRPLDAPEMAAVRTGVARVLAAYDPFPCLAVDRRWDIVAANPGATVLLGGVAARLLQRPNAMRIALHPDGLAPRIANLAQWRGHVLERLRREVREGSGGDALLAEVQAYPGGSAPSELGAVAVPLELDTVGGRRLTFLSTVTTFGTALDLTAAELSIEAFLPADDATAAALL